MLNFGEQISHQMRRIGVWWDCAMRGGSFSAVVGVGQLPLVTDKDITTDRQEFVFLTLSLLSMTDGLQKNPPTKIPLCKGEGGRASCQQVAVFLGIIDVLKLAKICVSRY